MNLIKINTNYILFLLIPFVFIIGNAAINLLVFFFLLFLLNKINFIKDLILSNRLLFFIFSISLFYFFLNALFLGQNSKSIYSALSLIKFPIIYCFILYSFKNLKDKHLYKIFFIWFIFFIFLELDTLIQFFAGKNIFGFEAELIYPTRCMDTFIYKFFDLNDCPTFLKVNRLSGMFDSELVIGGFLAHFFIIILSFLYFFKKKKVSIYFLVLTFFIVFFSGERMSFLLLTLSIMIFFVLL